MNPARAGGRDHFSLHISERKLLLIVGDLGCFGIAYFAGRATLHQGRLPYAAGVLIGALLWWGLGWVNGAYDLETASRPAAILRVIGKMSVGLVLAFIVYAFTSRGQVGRTDWAITLLAELAMVVAWRLSYLRIFTLPLFSRRILFVGLDDVASDIAEAVSNTWSSPYLVLGFASSASAAPGSARSKVVGSVTDVGQLAARLQASEIVATASAMEELRDTHELVHCVNAGYRVTPAASMFEYVFRRVPVEHIDTRTLIDLVQGAFADRAYLGIKRLVDLALGGIGLVALGAVLPFVALAILLDSSGPIFYRQERVGLRGRRFMLTKFRTMATNAEVRGEPVWAAVGDRRVTRVGRFLRLSRIDELPQVVNIIRGEMAVVGPRPERPHFVAQLTMCIPWYDTRHSVKPGLTGWAQINAGYGGSIEDSRRKLEFDLYYVRRQSILLDTLIVLRTFGVLARLRGR